jgi:4-amino-4-deoxy-L-arabinose transferase-like glycosyltransferase
VKDAPRHSFGLALSLLFFLAAVRMVVLSGEYYPLHGDEAQYWLWSKSLDWGYYSKPPLLSWIIALTTAVLGDREFGVRFASPFLHFATALVIYRIGEKLFDRRIGFYSALTYGLLPAVTFSSLIMSTDVPLLLCWAVGLYAYLRVLEPKAEPRWWLVLGGAVGLGMLAKYAMLFFLGGMALHMTLWRRDLWTNPRLWAAAAFALLVFSPNIWWNAQHQFATISHTAANANLDGTLMHPKKLAEFVGGQLGVFGPLLFPVLLVALGALLFRPILTRTLPDERLGLLAAFALTPLAVMLTVAFLSRANANWAATAYVSATVLVVALTLDRARWRWIIPASLGLHIAVMGVGYGYHDLAKLAGVTLTRKTDPALKAVMGSPALGKAVRQTLQQMPGAVLMTDERMIFALLSFYVRPPAQQVQWNPDGLIQNHFELTTRIEDFRRDTILYVTRQENPAALARFETAETVGRITIPLAKDYAKVFYLFRVQGLRE